MLIFTEKTDLSGIYLHIPFCKKACYYCDFHFSTSLKSQKSFVLALLQEIKNKKNYLQNETIKTIYFGGGTPSLLSSEEIIQIIKKIKKHHKVSPTAEITLEANPDDLTKEKTEQLSSLGINRLSIGIQTYQEELLKKINRSHNKKQAIECVQNARETGIKNLNLDLIFGLPDSTFESFKEDIGLLLKQTPQHISAYWMTIEEKTVFGKWHKKGLLKTLPDENALKQWTYLKSEFKKAGYLQYEISNFAQPNFESNHNGNYWKGTRYLGLGPSAHSYNGSERTWNVANNSKYIKAIEENKEYQTTEILSREDKINEHIMTRLRTSWGIDLLYLKNELSFDLVTTHQSSITLYESKKEITISENKVLLTDKGQQFADQIASDLFI